ncbi:MAG: hypothetical protein OHK0026_12450 [Rhodocyclaceae bacterium]
MDLQNLAYALIQIAHNFGAVAVTGGAIAARWPRPQPQRRPLAWLILAGWGTQAASGAGFGAVSYASYGQLPDIHGVAIAALVLKMACALSGFALSAAWLRSGGRWSPALGEAAWVALAILAAVALAAAAFLRWFS